MITLHVLFGFLLQGAVFFGAIYYFNMVRGEFSFVLFVIVAIPAVLLVRFLWRKCLPVKCSAEDCDGMAYCEGSRPIVFRCHTCGNIVETNWHEGRRRTIH